MIPIIYTHLPLYCTGEILRAPYYTSLVYSSRLLVRVLCSGDGRDVPEHYVIVELQALFGIELHFSLSSTPYNLIFIKLSHL